MRKRRKILAYDDKTYVTLDDFAKPPEPKPEPVKLVVKKPEN